MTRAIWLLVTGTFWAVMMTALVKREILPFFEYQAPPTYRTMLRYRTQPELERRLIRTGAEKRGQIESLLQPMENGAFRIRTKMDMALSVPGVGSLVLSLRTEVNIDAAYQLADFSISSNSLGFPIRMSGMRRGAKLLLSTAGLSSGLGHGVEKAIPNEIEFPRDMTLADGFLPYLGGTKLSVGKKWLVQTMELGLQGLKPQPAFARVERRESRSWRGQEVSCHVVEIRRRESDELPWHTLWVNEDGLVLEEEMSHDKLVYSIVLEERRTLSTEEVKSWEWDP